MSFARLQLDVVKALSGNFLFLSKHKFGSNVVEKIISMRAEPGAGASTGDLVGPGTPFGLVLTEILVDGGLEKLLNDPFANYVVQGVIKTCTLESEALSNLRERISDYDRHHPGWVRNVHACTVHAVHAVVLILSLHHVLLGTCTYFAEHYGHRAPYPAEADEEMGTADEEICQRGST